jgi:exonuclease SbcC
LKNFELQLDLAVIDEKKKSRCIILETERKKRIQKELKKAELTTLNVSSDGTILMDLGNWYTIRESFKQ